MLKLKLQYFGHLMQRANSLEQPWFWERLKAGGEGDDRGWDCWMASPTWWTWISASSRRWWRTGNPGVLQSMGSQIVRHEWLNNSKKVFWGISIIQAKNDSSLILGNRSEGFPCGSVEKNLPAMQEMLVWSPSQEDPLEEGMATSIPVYLPGKFHGQRSLVGHSP